MSKEEKLKPVFVVGSSRSGTSLLAAMLNAHSELACGPESQILNKITADELQDIFLDPNWPKQAVEKLSSITLAEQRVIDVFGVSPDQLENALSDKSKKISSLFEALCGTFAAKQGKSRWVEKTPRHLLHLPVLRKEFPQARIIRIVRDPRDSALSMRQLPWASNHYLPNLYLWCEWYSRSHDFFLNDSHSLTVSYESLVRNTEQTLKQICEFIDVQFEVEMMNTSRSAKSVATKNEPWKEQVSGPMDPSRLERWRNELDGKEAELSNFVAKRWLEEFGYPVESFAKRNFALLNNSRLLLEHNRDLFCDLAGEGIAIHDARFYKKQVEKLLILDAADPLVLRQKNFSKVWPLVLRELLIGRPVRLMCVSKIPHRRVKQALLKLLTKHFG